MEAANTSAMSVNFYQTTWRNNPEDSHLHIRRRENMKSHLLQDLFLYQLISRSFQMAYPTLRVHLFYSVSTVFSVIS
jgi:hypothetical protein